jgi:hypothetical protein
LSETLFIIKISLEGEGEKERV